MTQYNGNGGYSGPGDDDRTACERTVDEVKEGAANLAVAAVGSFVGYLAGEDNYTSRRDSRVDDEDGDMNPTSPIEDIVDDALDFFGF